MCVAYNSRTNPSGSQKGSKVRYRWFVTRQEDNVANAKTSPSVSNKTHYTSLDFEAYLRSNSHCSKQEKTSFLVFVRVPAESKRGQKG